MLVWFFIAAFGTQELANWEDERSTQKNLAVISSKCKKLIRICVFLPTSSKEQLRVDNSRTAVPE
jgi:hypothetical protein